MQMNRRSILAALFLIALPGVAQNTGQQKVTTVRLYVFDCGRLKSGNPAPLLERGVTTTDMSVEAFLIVHPRGTLLWDAGVIPDELVKPEGTVEARATVHTTLKGQLAAIGYKPADITYLALSHNHYDHSANGNAFAGSTWLVQGPERAFMFPDTPPATPGTQIQINQSARWSELKNSRTIVLNGDYDVFGDGSVVIIATPGHTPGHQSLFVNLKNTGPVVLSGDLYHYPAERELKDFTPLANLGVPAQEDASKAKVEALLKQKHAMLWIQHDIIADAKLKKSPAYYE
jgi:glyoxylase-like metal-dependent hydrolase (beta-lactamase superfamily II)